jgi:hypothetical protein
MPSTPPASGLVLLCIFATALGCRSGAAPPATHPVRGTVRLDGQPVKGGVVEFRALAEPAWPTLGDIQPDGAFSLSIVHEGKRHPGALAGEYRVTVLFKGEGEKKPREPITLPKTYKVVEGDNTVTLNVTSP